MSYIDLHIHTEFTKGNGITRIKDLVKMAKEFGMKSLAITDSGSIEGFSEFYNECVDNDIKPILGCGFYLAPLGLENPLTHHLVLLAKDINGYRNLLKLSEYSFSTGFSFEKPRIDYSVLKRINSYMYCLTGGLGGVFDKPYITGNKELADLNLQTLKKIFSYNLFLELQDNGLEDNVLMKNVLRKKSEQYNIKMVVTGGSFYLDRDHSFICNQVRKENGNRELKGNGYYFKSPEEIESAFSEFSEAVNYSSYIAERCNLKLNCFS